MKNVNRESFSRSFLKDTKISEFSFNISICLQHNLFSNWENFAVVCNLGEILEHFPVLKIQYFKIEKRVKVKREGCGDFPKYFRIQCRWRRKQENKLNLCACSRVLSELWGSLVENIFKRSQFSLLNPTKWKKSSEERGLEKSKLITKRHTTVKSI